MAGAAENRARRVVDCEAALGMFDLHHRRADDRRRQRQLPVGPITWYHEQMSNASGGTTKRKRPAGAGVQIQVRLQPEQLADIDAWIETRSHPMTRPEAIRQLALAKARHDLDTGD